MHLDVYKRQLSGLIASMMDAQVLIILSNIDGIYNLSLIHIW